jgi:hypothetical protein
MKKLFLLAIVLLFPYLGFADNWAVLNTNKAEYPLHFLLQETDIITIREGEFLVIRNREKKQIAVIIIPGEKTVRQGIEEAKELEEERKNLNNNHLWETMYLLFKYSDYIRFWVQE